MLKLLHIENIAIIEECDIEFEPGFNVLTGETGAGKSIIIDSISAVLGERTTRELVRTGASRAKVMAVFDELSTAVVTWLFDHGIDDADELMLQREISADGKSTCRVNGNPVSVGVMKELGSLLLNIHGQHDSQALLFPERHSEFIDRFAELDVFDKYYNNKMFDRIFTTNSVYITDELKSREWFCEVNVHKYIAYYIEALTRHYPVSMLIDSSSRIEKLLAPLKEKNANNQISMK